MRRLASLLVAAALVTAAPIAAHADGPRPRNLQLELGLWGGVLKFDEAHELYDSDEQAQRPLRKWTPEGGLRIGFYPWSFIGLEGEGGVAPSKVRGTDDQVNVFSVRGSLVLQIPLRVTPFVLGGIGNFASRSDALGDDMDTDLHAGAGLKLFAGHHFQLRVDGRVYRSNKLRQGTDDNGEVNHYAVNGALVWVIGGRRPMTPVGDRDGDGINDDVDECPSQAGPGPSGCPPRDGDGDGLTDDVDKCPEQAETVNGVEDTDGCPDEEPDADGDGIRGAADKCPTQPEDADSFEDEDGCPDEDNDKDGLLDAADACPTEAGPPENRGCPDKDKDGDTVVDRLDNCPDEAGSPANQGCKDKQLVVITQDQLKILDRVYFKTNKAVIEKRSHKLLNNVATVLMAHPEIKKIRIEGHTDSDGPDDKNKTLSQARAEAVASYLARQGVPSERLEPIGYGEEKPIADNGTKAGKAENRRVEFNIVPSEAPAATP